MQPGTVSFQRSHLRISDNVERRRRVGRLSHALDRDVKLIGAAPDSLVQLAIRGLEGREIKRPAHYVRDGRDACAAVFGRGRAQLAAAVAQEPLVAERHPAWAP